MAIRLTDPQFRMLRFLATPSMRGGHDETNPAKIVMLRHLEEQGLTSRGSITRRRPRWIILAKGRAILCPECVGFGACEACGGSGLSADRGDQT